MAPRYPVRWLMTDERLGDALWAALRRLPPGSGVVFRHHATPAAERRMLLRRVERIAAARRLVLLVAGGRGGKTGGYGAVNGAIGRAAHDRRQAIEAARRGATLLFVSPVFSTRSHPGATPLGPLYAAQVASGFNATVIALGGMDDRRWRRIAHLGFDGWAGIDVWARVGPNQKRNTVPT